MKAKYITSSIILLVLFLALSTSAQEQHEEHQQMMIKKAICVLYPTESNQVHGTVSFLQTKNGVKITANLSGLSEGVHGFHIHQFGDCSADNGTSAGGHFNPEGHEHGSLTGEISHIGDLGNITANADGIAYLEFTTNKLVLSGNESIIGRSIIIHDKADDLTSQPTGNAGSRVACGVIGIAK